MLQCTMAGIGRQGRPAVQGCSSGASDGGGGESSQCGKLPSRKDKEHMACLLAGPLWTDTHMC